MSLLKGLKRIFLYSMISLMVVVFTLYLYIENGAKIYFPEKERNELINNIKSAPPVPNNFIEFYDVVYPKSLKDNYFKKFYRQFINFYTNRGERLPSQNVANISISPFLNNNSHKNSLNTLFLIRYIEQETTQQQCLNYELKNYNFLYNRKGIEAVSQDLFQKPVKELKPLEIAEIIALLENPTRNNRFRNPEKANQRTNVFLRNYELNRK